ncbi:DUF3592 domain-containing protein [Paenarthrobacter sp. RAF54_2]|uniref:hypothetical protein n=1 Tax=Paenarthrobacter sp. RAF54_2 TaxID=3233061 RepID=UPI003F9CD3CF
MTDSQGSGPPIERVGGESTQRPLPGANLWSLALPGGVLLKATPCSAEQVPVWQDSSLRRRMRATMVGLAVAMVTLLVAAGFGLGAALAPLAAGALRVEGVVTSQQASRFKGNDYCTLEITYTLDGQLRHAAVESGRACAASAQTGTPVHLALNPNNTEDVVLQGYDYPRENAWKGIAVMAPMAMVTLVVFMVVVARSYYSTTRLFMYEAKSWRELSVTVRARMDGREGTTLFLEAKDTSGDDRIFSMFYRRPGLRPKPRTDDVVELRVLSDRGARAVITVNGDARIHSVTLAVPSSFQRRSMGL